MTSYNEKYQELSTEIRKLVVTAEELQRLHGLEQEFIFVDTNVLTLDPDVDSATADKLISTAEDVINLATTIADAHNFTLDFDLAYGMGGTYHPAPTKWHSSGWVSSSSQC